MINGCGTYTARGRFHFWKPAPDAKIPFASDVPYRKILLSREDLNVQRNGAAGPLGEERR